MTVKLIKILFILINFLVVNNVYSQEQPADTLNIALIDTICYKYNFNPGDTLTYRVVSHDSIIIDYNNTLLKTRFEKIQIVCDSVKNNKYYMSQTLLNFIAYETAKEVQNVERTENPWIGRTIWYVIDSLGNRFAIGYDDSSKAALTPGGAFQPHLIFSFDNSCHKIDQTWLVGTLDELPENGLPLPLINQTSLFRALPPIDTLDWHCNRLSYIKTAQGSYSLKSENDTMRVTNIITGYGLMDISSELNIPIHYQATIEQKLTISISDEPPKPGWHYIASFFTLDSFRPMQKKK